MYNRYNYEFRVIPSSIGHELKPICDDLPNGLVHDTISKSNDQFLHEFQVDEITTSVRYGIMRFYGLNEIQVGDLIDLPKM